MDRTTEIDSLIRECSDLLNALMVIDPNHGLCIFDTKGEDLEMWNEITTHFYNHFLEDYKPWKSLSMSECQLAWYNFRVELMTALAITHAKKP